MPTARLRVFISNIIEQTLTSSYRYVISSLIERMSHAFRDRIGSRTFRVCPSPPAGTVLRRQNSLVELSLMKADDAVEALAALAQEHRLALYRLLVQAGETGMAAGAIAEKLRVPNSSLSFHLAQLRNAGLILQERHHRSLIYRANYPAMNGLVAFLTENCCGSGECSPSTACETLAQERKSA